jgi:hypothetical protein
MRRILRRVGGDMRNLQNIEAYAVAGVGFTITVVSLFGDAVSDEVKWSTLFSGLGVMVYRAVLPRACIEGAVERFVRPDASIANVTLPSGSAHVCVCGTLHETSNSPPILTPDGSAPGGLAENLKVVVLRFDGANAVRVAAIRHNGTVRPAGRCTSRAIQGRLRVLCAWARRRGPVT